MLTCCPGLLITSYQAEIAPPARVAEHLSRMIFGPAIAVSFHSGCRVFDANGMVLARPTASLMMLATFENGAAARGWLPPGAGQTGRGSRSKTGTAINTAGLNHSSHTETHYLFASLGRANTEGLLARGQFSWRPCDQERHQLRLV